jgi:predicted amidophosphoribosyltransferase
MKFEIRNSCGRSVTMNSTPVCSQCQQPLTQVGKHWICPEYGQVSPKTKPSATLRIFLS